MKSKIMTVMLCTAAALLAFAGVATAQSAAGAGGEPFSLWDILRPVVEAFRGGDYAYAGALALVALVALGKQFGPKIPGRVGAFLGGDYGALSMLVVGAFAASVAAQVAGPAGLTIAVIGIAAKLAFYAGGGFAMVKRFAYPILVKLRGRLPAWARAALDVVLWLLDNGKARALAKATAAGAAAVAAKPAPGIAGVIGEPRDVP